MNPTHWVFRWRCGCPFGLTDGASSQSQAWRLFYETQRARDVATDMGVTVEPMSHDRYTAEVYPKLLSGEPCPHQWVLRIPAPAQIHSTNTGKPWPVTAEAKRQWRGATCTLARRAKLPRGLARVRIDVVLHFTTGRKRDAANYHPWCVKPIVDALGPARRVKTKKGEIRVEPGYGLISDDTHEHLDGPYPHIGDPVPTSEYRLGLAVVHIANLSGTGDG